MPILAWARRTGRCQCCTGRMIPDRYEAAYLIRGLLLPRMFFLNRRFSRVSSATTSISASASARRSFTSLLFAWRAVSPARHFLPASRDSFDQLWLIPSSRHGSAMLSSPQRPDQADARTGPAGHCPSEKPAIPRVPPIQPCGWPGRSPSWHLPSGSDRGWCRTRTPRPDRS